MADAPSNQPFKFRGFQAPNYTQVPDELFDQLLALLSGGELKVLLYVIRRTFGFKKGSDRISKSQLENGITRKNGEQLDNGTGLSRRAIRLSVDSLVEKNILLKHRHASAHNGDEATEYALNIAGQDPWVKSTPPGGGGAKSTQGEGRKVPPQETVKQETDKVVNALPANDPKPSSEKGSREPAISDRALRATYGFTDKQLGEVHFLVEKQAELLGSVERNHAHYVKRAAEAVTAGEGQTLDAKLGDFKQAATALTVKSAPKYFHAMWEEAKKQRQVESRTRSVLPAGASPRLGGFEPVGAIVGSSGGHPDARADGGRIAALIADAEGRGFRVPDQIRRTNNYQQVTRWWATLPAKSQDSER